MREVRAWATLGRHGLALLRAGQLRFRLETFGVYYPDLPYRRPAWQVSPRYTLLFLRQTRRYAYWLLEMEELRAGSPAVWWKTRR